jgi:hypothetical protein
MKRLNTLSKALIGLSTFVLAASAFAQFPSKDKDREVQCPKEEIGPCAYAFPKDMGLACPRNFYVRGEFLLMQSKEDGLEFALTNTNSATAGDVAPLTAGRIHGFSTESHKWDWDLGFRAGFGFYLNHDQWNVDASWTYLHIKNDKGTHLDGTGTVVPLWLGTVHVESSTDASARWKGEYNVIDFRLGKPYHVSKYLVMQPYFGARGGWIDQNYTARYSGTIDGQASSYANMKASNDWWGIGARAGVDTEWLLGNGWQLLGCVSTSSLYSKFDIDQYDDVHTHKYNIHHEFYTNIPNFELTLGLGYGQHFSKEKYYIGFKVAYEFIQWWDMNQMRKLFGTIDDGTDPANIALAANDTTSRGDLKINGFSFRVYLDF